MTASTDALLAGVVAVRKAAAAVYLARSRGPGKTIGMYDRQLWRACLDLFRGGDIFGFIDDFTDTIENQLTRAWNEGARAVGVEPGDMEDADLAKLQALIQSEHDHVLDLASAIDEARLKGVAEAEFRARFRARVDLWVNRYTEVSNEAKLHFGNRTRLEWALGATEEHCETCARLAGVVAYAEEWQQAGIHPQNPPNDILECGGWHCDCELRVTTRRRTPRALDKLLDIATAGKLG